MKLILLSSKDEMKVLIELWPEAKATETGFEYQGFQFVVVGSEPNRVTFDLITLFRGYSTKPSLVVFAGTCGAIDDRLSIMDLVRVGSVSSYDLESGELGEVKNFTNTALKDIDEVGAVCIQGSIPPGKKRNLLIEGTSASIYTSESVAFYNVVKMNQKGPFRLFRKRQKLYEFFDIRVVTHKDDTKSKIDHKDNYQELSLIHI